MFEVGKAYRITHAIGDEVWESTFKVVEVDMPLIKVEGVRGEVTVLNTHSPSFHSAQPFDGNFDEPLEIHIDLGEDAEKA